MAHPKRKISKTRRDKRRTHYKVDMPTLTTCASTGVEHPPHKAYKKDGKLYYRGKVVMELNSKK